MKARKTIKVAALVNRANKMLRESTTSPAGRWGIMHLLEKVLHETGNYRGFGYLTQEQVPPGELPGIRRPTLPEEDNPRPSYPDTTRVFYYGGRIGA